MSSPTAATATHPRLPPPLWTRAMEYLPLDAVASAATSCRSARAGSALVERLTVLRSSDLCAPASGGDGNVRRVRVDCLFAMTADETRSRERSVSVDPDAVDRTVDFLRRFPNLKSAVFGGKTRWTMWKEDWEVSPNEKDVEVEDFVVPACGSFEENDVNRLATLIDSISAVYVEGTLSGDLRIFGLCCPKSWKNHKFSWPRRDPPSEECKVCRRACLRFPMEAVASFENKGSTFGKSEDVRGERPCDLDVCLSRDQIVGLLESRPGGREFLRSELRILGLLWQGTRWRISPNLDELRRRSLYVVRYTRDELEDLERAIRHGELDAKRLNPEAVSNAIMRSFAACDSDSPPPKQLCYLSQASFNHLKDKLGIPMDYNVFYGYLDGVGEALPLLSYAIHSGEVYDIIEDCATLARLLIEKGGENLSQEAISVACTLACENDKSMVQLETARIAAIIVRDGSGDQVWDAIMESFLAGAIVRGLLCEPNEEETVGLLKALYRIVPHIDVKEAVAAGGIAALIKLVASPNVIICKFAILLLHCIVKDSPKYRASALKKGIMGPLNEATKRGMDDYISLLLAASNLKYALKVVNQDVDDSESDDDDDDWMDEICWE